MRRTGPAAVTGQSLVDSRRKLPMVHPLGQTSHGNQSVQAMTVFLFGHGRAPLAVDDKVIVHHPPSMPNHATRRAVGALVASRAPKG